MSTADLDDRRSARPDRPGRPGGGPPVTDGPAPDAPGGPAALAGLVSVAASLGLAELVAGLTGAVPSLVTSVGQLFIPLVPAWLKDLAISLFGVADKPVLVAGVVVVSLLLGLVVGRRARRDVLVPSLAFVGLGGVGAVAALQQAGARVVPTSTTAIAAAAIGLGTLLWLLRLLAASTAPATASAAGGAAGSTPDGTAAAGGDAIGRRRFLVATGAVGAGAAGAGALGYVTRQSRIADVVDAADVELEEVPAPRAAPTVTAANRLDVDGITPIVVPTADFYRIDTALGTPAVDAATWSLRIEGMVEEPIELGYDDLTGGDVVERHVTLSCVSNEVGGSLVGNALWRGVLLAPLLERAGVQDGVGQVVGRSVDGFTAGFPIEAAFDRDAMVAFAMNDEPLPAAHGFPARLVVPGLYGYVSATKWLDVIELTTWEGFDGYWVPRGWSKEGPIKTQSRIDVPDDGTRLDAAGPTVVAGVAWDPGPGIAGVEVRRRDDAAEDGGPWTAATLSEPLADSAWVQWRAELDLPEGPSFVQVRATNGDGDTQTSEEAPPAPDGASGWHTIRVFT